MVSLTILYYMEEEVVVWMLVVFSKKKNCVSAIMLFRIKPKKYDTFQRNVYIVKSKL